MEGSTRGRQGFLPRRDPLQSPERDTRCVSMGETSERDAGDPVSGAEALGRGRDAYERRAWRDAWHWLSRADRAAPLAAEDIEQLATAAYLAGQDADYLQALDRAHRAFLDQGRCERAVRCAFWLGLRLVFRGEIGRATGWFGRAERLLQGEGKAGAEEGYLLLPVAERQLGSGDAAAACATAERAADIGDRFGETDLSACARHVQGRAMLRQGRVDSGLALLDEAMVAVTAGELSPIMTGLVYCSVIDGCQEVCALDRAREWTAALSEWCAAQPQLLTFTGACLAHRAEIMQISGAWQEAIEEARRACEALAAGSGRKASAAAWYQQGEVHRLCGDYASAEAAYREASRFGGEPQPGLALLRLAQGRTSAASAAIRRALGSTEDTLQRARMLPAAVEILCAAGALEEARSGCLELEETAACFGSRVLEAFAAQARGQVALAEGDAYAALASLRRAFRQLQDIEAPYHAARARESLAIACREVGDDEAADLELEAAGTAFKALGAAPDLARVDSLRRTPPLAPGGGLTARELQVLRLMASGKSNKVIASELRLSKRTIDRHASNIFTKIDVPSRAAATAWAYEHGLV